MNLHRVQVKHLNLAFLYLSFPEEGTLLGEHDEAAPSLTEPVVVGEECEEGVKGRFVLVQKETGATAANMWFHKVLVNHTEEGRIINVD